MSKKENVNIITFDSKESSLDNKIYKVIYNNLKLDHTYDINFLKNLKIKKKKIICSPFNEYDYDFKSHWSASFGFDRIETYTEYVEESYSYETYELGRKVTKWDKRTVPKTRTKTVTDWRPASGTYNGSLKSIIYIGKYFDSSSTFISEIISSNYDIFKKNETELNKKNYDHIDKLESDTKITNRFASEAYSSMDASVRVAVSQGDHSRDWSISGDPKVTNITKYKVPFLETVIDYAKKDYTFNICIADSINMNNILGTFDHKLPKDKEKEKEFIETNNKKWTGLYIFIGILISWFSINNASGIQEFKEFLGWLSLASAAYAAWIYKFFSAVYEKKVAEYLSNLKNIFKEKLVKN